MLSRPRFVPLIAAALVSVLGGCAGCLRSPMCGAPAAEAAAPAALPQGLVGSSGTFMRALPPLHLVDANGAYVGQYIASGPGTPATAMVKLDEELYVTLWVDGPQGQLRAQRGLVLSARPDCQPPYYLERRAEWQDSYPGALMGEMRVVEGRRLVFTSRGRWVAPPTDTPLYVVGTCQPTYGYQRAVSPVERVFDLTGRLQEPFRLR